MNFAEAKAHAMGILFDTDLFSTAVTYIPHGKDPIEGVSANIIFGKTDNVDGIRGDRIFWRMAAERDVRSDFSRGGSRSVATVTIKVSDIPAPQVGDEFEMKVPVWIDAEGWSDVKDSSDTETWTIAEVFDNV